MCSNWVKAGCKVENHIWWQVFSEVSFSVHIDKKPWTFRLRVDLNSLNSEFCLFVRISITYTSCASTTFIRNIVKISMKTKLYLCRRSSGEHSTREREIAKNGYEWQNMYINIGCCALEMSKVCLATFRSEFSHEECNCFARCFCHIFACIMLSTHLLYMLTRHRVKMRYHHKWMFTFMQAFDPFSVFPLSISLLLVLRSVSLFVCLYVSSVNLRFCHFWFLLIAGI